MYDKPITGRLVDTLYRGPLLFPVLLMLFLACSSHDDTQYSPHEDTSRLPLRLNALLSPDATRGTGTGHMHDIEAGTVFTAGRYVDIFITESGNVESDPEAWRYDGTVPCYLKADGAGYFSWYSDAQRSQVTRKFWSPTGNSLYLYAWYPHGVVSSLWSQATFTVPTAQGSADGDSSCDLMVGIPRGVNPVSPTADDIPLAFIHRLAKVQVNMNGSNATVHSKLQAAQVTLGPDVLLTCTLDPITAEVTTAEDGATGTVTIKDSGLAVYDGTTLAHYCLIPPQRLTGQTLHIGDAAFQIPQKDGRDIVAAAGLVYTVNLSVDTPDGIRMTVDIAPWDEVEEDIDYTN